MQSFADYRKEQLQETINDVCVKEGVVKHFEILRLELLESIRLPQILVEGSGIEERAEYSLFVEEDFQYNRAFIEELIHLHKVHFYDELLAEADVAAASQGADMQNFKAKLVHEVKRMIGELRDQIRAILNPEVGGGGEVSSAAHAAAGEVGDVAAPAGAPDAGGAGPAGAPAGEELGIDGGETGAPAAGGGDPYPRWSAYRGDERPEQGGFQPAAYGNKVPTGGIRGGLSRLWRRMTRPVRRIWHGDPTREMGKFMKREQVEQVITEQWDQIEPLLVDFERNILGYIDKSFASIGMGGAPSVPGAPSPGVPSPGVPGVPTPPEGGGDTIPIDDEMGPDVGPDEIAPTDQGRMAGPTPTIRQHNSGRKAARAAAYEFLKTTKELTAGGKSAAHGKNIENIMAALNEKESEISLDPQLQRFVAQWAIARGSSKDPNKTTKKTIRAQMSQHFGVKNNAQPVVMALLEAIGKALGVEIPDKPAPAAVTDDNFEAGEIGDQIPQDSGSGSEINPVAAATAAAGSSITEEPPEALPVGTDGSPKTSVREVMVALLSQEGLYDSFRKIVKGATQEAVKGAIKVLIDEDDWDLDKFIKTSQEGLSKHPIEDQSQSGEKDIGGNKFDNIMNTSYQDPEEEVHPQEVVPPEEEVPPPVVTPGTPTVRPQGATQSPASKGVAFNIANWEGLGNAIESAELAMQDDDDSDDADAALIDAMGRKVEDDVDVHGIDPQEAWDTLMGYLPDFKGDLKSMLAELDEEYQGFLKQTAEEEKESDEVFRDDDMGSEDDNYGTMGFESFQQKIDRFKKQLREHTTMGESKYKKQREKLLT